MPELLSPGELAKKLNVPTSWVYDKSRRKGENIIPHYRIGKYIRFVFEDVLDWIEKIKGNA